MKRESIFRGLGRAVVLSIACVPAAYVARWVLPQSIALNTLVAVITFAAIVDILRVSGGGVGKTALAALAFAALGAGIGFPTDQLILLSAALIWLTRSVISYSSIIPAGLDAGVTALSLGAASWTVATGSGFTMGVWVFFLVQALTAKIPRRMTSRSAAEPAPASDPFDQAYNSAEHALRRIIARA